MRKTPLARGTTPLRASELARRTPLKRGRWRRASSELWEALEAAGIEHDKGIHERYRHDEEREAEEWHRVYGSLERVLYTKYGGQCTTPGCGARECDNSHYGTEGTGRKAHFTRIFRQCRACHIRVGDIGWPAFLAEHPGLDPERECELLEIHWQEHGAEWIAWYYGDDAVDGPPSTVWNHDPRYRGYYP